MLFRVTDEPLAPDMLHSEVLAPTDGAVVTFAGVVRNHSDGQETQYLEYEAYAEMAEAKLAEIGRQARDRWDIGDMAIVHRTGRLHVGETSVLIAVASSHRAEAFEACRFAIERIKESVPIWKKEVTTSGAYWVEGPASPAPR